MGRFIVAVTGFTLGVLAVGSTFSPAAVADVRVGVNIGVPGVVVAPPPPVVIAPGVPVYYYGSSYYTFYNGGWFLGPAYGGPWHYVPVARVPRPIIAVPNAYLHVPHHRHHIAGPAPWHHGKPHGGKHHGGHHHRH